MRAAAGWGHARKKPMSDSADWGSANLSASNGPWRLSQIVYSRSMPRLPMSCMTSVNGATSSSKGERATLAASTFELEHAVDQRLMKQGILACGHTREPLAK